MARVRTLLLAVLSTLALRPTRATNPTHEGTFGITNVYLFDGHTLTPTLTSLVVHNGLISNLTLSSLPPTTRLIDGRGGTLIPGLIDSHIHLGVSSTPAAASARLADLRSQGITTAFDLNCVLGDTHTSCDALNLALSPSPPSLPFGPPYPTIFFSYLAGATANSSHGPLVGASNALSTDASVDAWIADRLAEPSLFVKLVLTDPGPSFSAAAARRIADAAHSAGKLVACHAARRPAFDVALHAGCDQLHHMPSDEPLGPAQVADIRRRGLLVVPTLVQMRRVADGMRSPLGALMRAVQAARAWWLGAGWRWPDLPRYEPSSESVGKLLRAGVDVAVGTDALAEKVPVYGQVGFADGFGVELLLLQDAGMHVLDILRAATEVPARRWGLRDRGSLHPGKRADLVLLRARVTDAADLRDVRRVWIGGVEVESDATGEGRGEGREEL